MSAPIDQDAAAQPQVMRFASDAAFFAMVERDKARWKAKQAAQLAELEAVAAEDTEEGAAVRMLRTIAADMKAFDEARGRASGQAHSAPSL